VPELPDVEGFRRTFARHAAGKIVRAVSWIDRSMLRDVAPSRLSRALEGQRFAAPERQGKLLICLTESERTLLFHFGMTGTFVWCEGGPRHQHDRMALWFDDGSCAIATDLVYRCAQPPGCDLPPMRRAAGEADRCWAHHVLMPARATLSALTHDLMTLPRVLASRGSG
jgi:hypothetical protein